MDQNSSRDKDTFLNEKFYDDKDSPSLLKGADGISVTKIPPKNN